LEKKHLSEFDFHTRVKKTGCEYFPLRGITISMDGQDTIYRNLRDFLCHISDLVCFGGEKRFGALVAGFQT
jgi:hypothetical protein